MLKKRCTLEIYGEQFNLLKKLRVSVIKDDNIILPYWIISNKKHKYMIHDHVFIFLCFNRGWLHGELIEPDLVVFSQVQPNSFGREWFRTGNMKFLERGLEWLGEKLGEE